MCYVSFTITSFWLELSSYSWSIKKILSSITVGAYYQILYLSQSSFRKPCVNQAQHVFLHWPGKSICQGSLYVKCWCSFNNGSIHYQKYVWSVNFIAAYHYAVENWFVVDRMSCYTTAPQKLFETFFIKMQYVPFFFVLQKQNSCSQNLICSNLAATI